MKRTYLLVSALILIFNCCSPKMRSAIVSQRPPLVYDSEVFVVSIARAVPKNAEEVGKLSITDTGFTVNCGYEFILEQAKLAARENGANIVKIIEHKTPNFFGSSCHRLKVAFYLLSDTTELTKNLEN